MFPPPTLQSKLARQSMVHQEQKVHHAESVAADRGKRLVAAQLEVRALEATVREQRGTLLAGSTITALETSRLGVEIETLQESQRKLQTQLTQAEEDVAALRQVRSKPSCWSSLVTFPKNNVSRLSHV
jgi:hypothetical protein